jgi:hypothetical protein
MVQVDNLSHGENEGFGAKTKRPNLWIAKRRAKEATVFSPPKSCSMSRNRFIGGIA